MQYETLLAHQKGDEAAKLLDDKIAREQRLLDLQRQYTASQTVVGGDNPHAGDYNKFEEASNALKAVGLGVTKQEVESQQELVNILLMQATAEQRVAELKKLNKGNATTSANQAVGNDRDAQMRASLEDAQKQMEQERQLRQEASRTAIQETTRKEDATISLSHEGSVARLNAIRDAMAEEESLGLDGTEHYQELLKQRNELAQKLDDEARQQREKSALETAANEEKSAELTLSAEKQHQALLDSARRMSEALRISEAQKFATDEYNIKRKALLQEEADLDKSGKDYNNKLKQLQDQEKQLTQAHENELAAIREKAEIATNNKLAASYQQFTSTISSELSKTIMGHQTMAHMVESLGDQMIGSMIKNALQYAMSNKFRQESDAKAAASAGFKLGMEIGGPAGAVLAPVLAAVAFAGAMAFEGGGVVPGVGRGDIVPAMLEPGEGIVPGGVMDGLRNMARNGGFDQSGPRNHVTMHVSLHGSALDADGMDTVLEKHADKLQRHFENTLRKMNR
jgi:hypothetical protein